MRALPCFLRKCKSSMNARVAKDSATANTNHLSSSNGDSASAAGVG